MFPANQTDVDVTVTLLRDGVDEGPETIITRVLAGTGYQPGGRPEDMITIFDHH